MPSTSRARRALAGVALLMAVALGAYFGLGKAKPSDCAFLLQACDQLEKDCALAYAHYGEDAPEVAACHEGLADCPAERARCAS